MLGTQCPNVLYPVRAPAISDLIQAGGFPPFFMQPINFEALYAEDLRQRAASRRPVAPASAARRGGNA